MSFSKSRTLKSIETMPKATSKSRGALHRFRKNRVAVVGLGIVMVNALMAIFSYQLAPFDPLSTDMNRAFTLPNSIHLLGADQVGRDILSRIIHGARVSFIVGFISVGIGLVLGVTLGTLAAWYRGRVDGFIQMVIDIWLSVPGLILAMAIVATLGPGLQNTMIAIGIAITPGFARIVRGQVLSITEKEFIQAQKVLGFSIPHIILKSVLPNSLSPITVIASFSMAGAILSEAALSFIGLGVPPTVPTWGSMLNEARIYILSEPLLSVFPGATIMMLVLGFNFLGDGLRDAVDPKLKV